MLVRHTTKMVRKLINGFYVADHMFCNESNIDLMCIYLDDGDGYIIIRGQSGKILLNTSFKYNLYRATGMTAALTDAFIYRIEFSDIECTDFFPLIQYLEFMPTTQRIKLFDKDSQVIYGVLYKNNSATDMQSLIGISSNTPISDANINTADITNCDFVDVGDEDVEEINPLDSKKQKNNIIR